MSDTQTPQGVMTVLRKPSYEPEDILKGKKPLIMVLEDLQDPGNAGTISVQRRALAWMVFSYKNLCGYYKSQSDSCYNGISIQNALCVCGRCGIPERDAPGQENSVFAAHLQGKNAYHEEDYTGGTAFLIGNEGKGLTEEAAEAADCLIRIPMCGQVESLNAAMAAGILMYEAARQRRG